MSLCTLNTHDIHGSMNRPTPLLGVEGLYLKCNFNNPNMMHNSICVCMYVRMYVYMHACMYIKGIRFIVLYPPKRSHDLPPLAGTVHTETISIPREIFQSNWQHIAHNTLSTALFMLGTPFCSWVSRLKQYGINYLAQGQTKVPGAAGNWTSDPLITSPTPKQLSDFVPYIYVCMYVCMYECINVPTHARKHYVCMYVWVCVRPTECFGRRGIS